MCYLITWSEGNEVGYLLVEDETTLQDALEQDKNYIVTELEEI